MRTSVANAVVPVAWPPLSEGACENCGEENTDLRMRRLLPRQRRDETDLNEYGAKFGNPKIFVSLVEWADKIITE
jgi:hypothetical protein